MMKQIKAHGGTGKKSHHHPTTDSSKPSWMSGVQHRHPHGTHDADGKEMKIHGTREEFEVCKDESCKDENCQFTRSRAQTLERSGMTNPKRLDPDTEDR